VHFHRKQTLRL